MCGICGVIDYTQKGIVSEETLRRMCGQMQHRGPDDEGIYLYKNGPSVGLGHRRLSIIDLSPLGHQPLCNEDKTVWVTLNGEIYNFKDLKDELEKKGHRFKSRTDTETIVHLYEEYREDCVKYLRGMFAFALWDEKKETLLLARDRPGKKPLLYYSKDGIFCFASEFNALLASGLVYKEINPCAIDEYLSFGYINAPLTIYNNIFKLPPAHMLILKDAKIQVKRYWNLDYIPKIKISEEEAAEEILRLLKEAVRIRLYSDVPLGAFLSGGIDSSTVVGLMSQLSATKVKTFSIGFEEKDFSELKYARKIAERFHTDHHEFTVRPKALDILALLVERYGEPYADSSCIPTYYVSKQTREYVTVALNGDGGDELFAGYERYQAMIAAEIYQKLPDIPKKIISRILNSLPDSVNPKNSLRRIKRFFMAINLPTLERYRRWVGIFDNGLKESLYTTDFKNRIMKDSASDSLAPNLGNLKELNLLDRLLMTDTLTYLPGDLLVKVDITSMANSLEARSPFLDHKLMEFAARLPAEYKMKRFIKKYILRKAVKDLIPQENIQRRKMGFGVPVGEWFRNDLKDFLCEILLSRKFLGRGYFRPELVRNIVLQHIGGRQDYSFQIWALLMFELWHQRFMD